MIQQIIVAQMLQVIILRKVVIQQLRITKRKIAVKMEQVLAFKETLTIKLRKIQRKTQQLHKIQMRQLIRKIVQEVIEDSLITSLFFEMKNIRMKIKKDATDKYCK